MTTWLPVVTVVAAVAVCWGGLTWFLFRE